MDAYWTMNTNQAGWYTVLFGFNGNVIPPKLQRMSSAKPVDNRWTASVHVRALPQVTMHFIDRDGNALAQTGANVDAVAWTTTIALIAAAGITIATTIHRRRTTK